MTGQIGSLVDGQNPMGLFGFQEDFVYGNQHAQDGVALFDLISGNGNANMVVTEENGVIGLTCGAGERAILSTIGRSFRLNYGKSLMMGARINLQDFDATSWFVGLVIADTSIITSLPADIVGFINALSRASSTSSRVEQTAHPFTADNQWRELKMLWDGNGRLTYYIDGALTQLFTANIPTRLPLKFAIEVEADAVELLWVDFAYCWQER